MRLDKCIAIIVIALVVLSTLFLIHAVSLTNSRINNADDDDHSNDDGDVIKNNHDNSDNDSPVKKKHVKLPPGVHNSQKKFKNKHQKKKKKKKSHNNDKEEDDDNNNNNNNNSDDHHHHLSDFFWGMNKKEKKELDTNNDDDQETNNHENGNDGDDRRNSHHHHVGWHLNQDEMARSCSDEFIDSLPTYDNYIQGGDGGSRNNKASSASSSHHYHYHPCDPYQVPFASDKQKEQECFKLMENPENWQDVKMIEPKFEQRTVKYVVTLKNIGEGFEKNNSTSSSSAPVKLLMKVPQQSFATEPFAEITAFAIDRSLRVNRIPPTVLVPFPLHRLHAAASESMSSFRMVKELGYKEENFTKWWESEFYQFVQKTKFPEVSVWRKSREDGKDAEGESQLYVWVSLQVMLEGVVPLLDSAARVPYSKKMSGWHRWFNPKWEGFSAVTNTTRIQNEPIDTVQPGYEPHGTKPYNELLHASMMALSELAIFDFVLLNNDRSPNKNNFVVEGCYSKRKWARHHDGGTHDNNDDGNDNKNGGAENRKNGGDNEKDHYRLLKMKPKEKFCSLEQISQGKFSPGGRERARRGHALSFVHLDQGMSFHGFSFVNNPIAKKFNNTFCMFYRPMMEKIRCFLQKHQTPEAAEKAFREMIPDVAEKALGRKKVRWMVGQLTLLQDKKKGCVERFGEKVVMQPQYFPHYQ